MATVIFGGDDVISHLSGGNASRGFLDYLGEMNERAGRFITESASRFLERSRSLRERRDAGEVRRMARAIKERVNHFWQEDTIRPLERVEDIQNAPRSMERWIMANPNVRRRVQEGVLDGYSETFVDEDSENITPERHIDYKRVMNGSWEDEHYVQYWDERLEDEEVTLSFQDKMAIKTTWAISDVGLDERRDVTSKWDVSF